MKMTLVIYIHFQPAHQLSREKLQSVKSQEQIFKLLFFNAALNKKRIKIVQMLDVIH